MPAAIFLVEFLFNRLEMSPKHVLYPIIAASFYLAMTAFSQFVTGTPIMPSALNWDFPDEERANDTKLFIVAWLVGTVVVYYLLLILHAGKALCCKRFSRHKPKSE